MCNDPKHQDIDLSYLVYASVGGSPTSEEDEKKINEFLISHGSKVLLTKGYGLSELSGCAIVTLDDYNSVGSIGVRLPLNDVVLRDDTGTIIKGAGKGEALIHSDTMTSGILDDKVIVPSVIVDGKKYLPTKDILELDEFGEYRYVERIDRMFPRYDAYNVYPSQIEDLFKSVDGISECVIVPIFDEKKSGYVPKAYIQLEKDDEFGDKSEFIENFIQEAFIKNSIPGVYKANYRDIPRVFTFVDEIPVNTMLKPNYHLLASQGVDGESYSVNVLEDNMKVSDISVAKVDKVSQKVLKKI